jgi:hypothetical protein
MAFKIALLQNPKKLKLNSLIHIRKISLAEFSTEGYGAERDVFQ